MLSLSAVDHGFQPWSSQTRLKLVFADSLLSNTAERSKSNSAGRLGIRIICPNEAACITMACCFVESN